MNKIQLHYLVGDVHMGGHDVHRVARANQMLLDAAGCFDVTLVCDTPHLGGLPFTDYFSSHLIDQAQVIVFNCGNYRFNTPPEQHLLEHAVSGGTGLVFLHGDHPCYWPEAGAAPWPEIEKMAMLMWRDQTSHGDYGQHHITLSQNHPITQGLNDFDTHDEIFCQLQNLHHVPCTPITWAYSDPLVISRHGLPGTGQNEVVAAVGRYGKGRTYNQALGHVWPYYTGHGLGENTLLSFMPLSFRQMFIRGCEWAATGQVKLTASFDGAVLLSSLSNH